MSRYLLPISLGSALVFTSCGEPEIRSYSVDPAEAKAEAEPAASATPPAAEADGMAPPAPGDPPMATTEGSEVTWGTPPNGTAVDPGSVRKGSFTIPGDDGTELDLSITAFPGDVGGIIANVNRWRGQLGLPELTATEMTPEIVTIGDGEGDLGMMVFDMAGGDAPDSPATSAAILPMSDNTWFFKLSGTSAAVSGYRGSFITFLKTVDAAGSLATGTESPDIPEHAMMDPEDAPPLPPFEFTAPRSWLAAPPSAMRAASLVATSENGATIDIAVIPIPGSMGTDLENVNRWRQQLQLDPVEETQLAEQSSTIDGKMGSILYIEIVSDELLIGGAHKAAIFAAIAKGPEHTWFFKMSGDAVLAAEHRDNFKEFIATSSAP